MLQRMPGLLRTKAESYMEVTALYINRPVLVCQ